MQNLLYKAASISATAALMLTMAAPVGAANLSIARNGARSVNVISVGYSNTGTTTQSNSGNTTTVVSNEADTGNNRANFNTGGDVGITTGAASATTGVTNTGHYNVAGDECGCPDDGALVAEIEENGAESQSAIGYSRVNARNRNQVNSGDATTGASNVSRTGRNRANFNTEGETSVTTADATASTTVDNVGHTNE